MSIIAVVGLPRSGTSMVMCMLHNGGVTPLRHGSRPADADNPGGYYEDRRVIRLGRRDAAWLEDLPGRKALKIVDENIETVPSGYITKAIVVRRRINERVRSFRRWRRNNGSPMYFETVAAEVPHEQATQDRLLARVDAWTMPKLTLWYHDILADPAAASSDIATFISGPFDESAAAAVVDPDLYHNVEDGGE